jgi:hypothetical protein
MAIDHHFILSLFHILGVVPFLLYIGLQRAATPTSVFTAAAVLGAFIIFYHGYKSYVRYMSSSPYLWVNLIHLFIVGPLLLFIGVKNRDTPRTAYELLLMTAFAALGYHLYSLINIMSNIQAN